MPIIDILNSFRVAGQFPLDAKLYHLTIESLTDLGENNQKAFSYHEGMVVYVNETKLFYEWKEVGDNTGGLIEGDYTYPNGVVANGVDYSSRVFNFFLRQLTTEDIVNFSSEVTKIVNSTIYKGNTLIEGGYRHVENYDYFVFASEYYLKGVYYDEYISDTVTLEAADANYDRIDVIIITEDRSINVITGVASENPSEPVIDNDNVIEIAFIIVKANTVSPPNVIEETIYDEDLGEPTEWNMSYKADTVDPDSTNGPNTGSRCIEWINPAIDDEIVFVNDGFIERAEDTLILFDIKLDNPNEVPADISFAIAGGSLSQANRYSRLWTVDSRNGISLTNGTDWQTASIKVSEGSFPLFTHFDLVAVITEAAGSNFRVDNIRIQKGIENPTTEKTRLSQFINNGEGAVGDQFVNLTREQTIKAHKTTEGGFTAQVSNGKGFIIKNANGDIIGKFVNDDEVDGTLEINSVDGETYRITPVGYDISDGSGTVSVRTSRDGINGDFIQRHQNKNGTIALVEDIQDISLDNSLQKYDDGEKIVIGSNISNFLDKFTWNTGDSTTLTLSFVPTNLLSIFVNGLKLYNSSQYTIIVPNQIEILQELEDGDIIDIRYEHYATEPI